MNRKTIVLTLLSLLAFAGIANAASGLLDNRSVPEKAGDRREDAIALQYSGESKATASRAKRRGPRGPRGPRGMQGAKGAAGPAGPAGTFGTVTPVSSPSVFLCGWPSGACSVGSVEVVCPSGTKLVSGGYGGAGIRAFISAPGGPNGWFVGAANEDEFSTTFKAIAMCAS
jgi:hypothetical protein